MPNSWLKGVWRVLEVGSLPSVIARGKVVVERVSIVAALALPLAPGG